MPEETAEELFRQGNDLYLSQDLQGAELCYRRALSLEPNLAAAHFNLGCTVQALAGPAAGLSHFAKAAELCPDWCEARSNFGFALGQSGRMAEAAVELEAAAALKPDDPGIRNNLALALSALGRGEDACASLKEAIRLDPLYAEAHNSLAILFERYGRISEAVACCEEALRLRPEYPEAHHNLASALRSQGRHTEAVAHLREALSLKPDFTEAHSSLLFTLCYPAGLPEEEVSAEHKLFGAAHRFAFSPHDNDLSPDRVINIGYVSADFRSHAVSRFIEPVLRHHDRSRFRITCYSSVPVPDTRTAVMKGLADCFVNIAGVPDEAACAMIRRDGIDILVDLSGHTADNRLLLFARKPAPVQVTWLGYPHTTGLEAIDYRITDSVTDPPGLSEKHYAEKVIRLPGTFSCFAPPEEAPEAGPPPFLSNEFVTFGSFNNPAKITPETVTLWAGVLRGVAGSRMLVKGYSLADAGTRERLSQLFLSHGIAPERLELLGNTASYRDHLTLYHRVDIALDTFPYHGTTTTCEALWMGVPIVTLCGVTHRSRVGASILRCVGLKELVTQDGRGFREAAIALAGDTGRMERLRKTLRKTMSCSPLTDGAGFTRNLESAYRDAWRRWCFDRMPVAENVVIQLRGYDKGDEDRVLPQLDTLCHNEAGTLSSTGAEMAEEVTQSLLKYAELLLKKGMQEEAQAPLQELLQRDADCARAHFTLAVIRASEGCLEDASFHFREALRLEPEEVKSWNGLGVALQQMGRPDEAACCYQEAVRINPRYQDARINLALLLKEHGRLSEAESLLCEGLRLEPGGVRLVYNLANVLHIQGRSLEAVAAYRETLRLDPQHLDAQQNLLFALHYSPQFSDRQIFAEHLRAGRKKMFRPDVVKRPDQTSGALYTCDQPTSDETTCGSVLPDANQLPHGLQDGLQQESQQEPRTRSRQECRSHKHCSSRSSSPATAGRRIRIGYLSPDFRDHSVARFIEPVLLHHDKTSFEIFCYANVARPDRTTDRLRTMVEHWVDLRGNPDDQAASAIAHDGIDILIDLAGHTSGNRLPLFARRPAPLQVTWIGYPDTTALPQIDYRITDVVADPPGRERFHTERLIRLPRCFCCYLPPQECPYVSSPPFDHTGRVTFGSFNNLAKVTPEMVLLWARVLQAVPHSTLLLKGGPLADPELRARILRQFNEAGVQPERIELHAGKPSTSEHLAQYGRVDIALDTFPYNGTTTTCEALWMGVPVITLAGDRHASRTGASILTSCGLGELIAADPGEYILLAHRLAEDLQTLHMLRRELRGRMLASPLMDAAGVTRELEQALKGMVGE